MAQVTVYLADDVVAELERLRTVQHIAGKGVPSRTKVLEDIVWDGLPSGSKIAIMDARRAKRGGAKA